MNKRDRLDSDSDWDSPSEHGGPTSPRLSEGGGDSIVAEHSESYKPKPRTNRSHVAGESPVVNGNDVDRHRNEDSVSDVLASAKMNTNSAYEPDIEPTIDFRQALASSDSLHAEPSVEVRDSKRISARESLYEETVIPRTRTNRFDSSAEAKKKRKPKRISFDLGTSEQEVQETIAPSYHRDKDLYPDNQAADSKVPPSDFDHYESVPRVVMEPKAERCESLLRRGYREAMTVIGIIFSFFMIFLEELLRIIALKIFSPVLHMLRYFLMAVIQLVLDLIEFFVIGLRRITYPLFEAIEVFVERCCLPLLRAFRPIHISFVSSAPVPHQVRREAYMEA